MKTNLKFFQACGAALLMGACVAQAQTIYKQVDAEGRVIFTDQPNPAAKVVASFEPGRPPVQAPAESDASRREAVESAARPVVELQPRPVLDPAPRPKVMTDSAPRPAVAPVSMAQAGPASMSQSAPSGIRQGDVERAISTLTPIASPYAAQVDANEAARRARQETRKSTGTEVLAVKPVARDADHHEKVKEGFTVTYVLWALTFFLMAGALLFIAWQTVRLILTEGFPRWQVGAA